MVEQAQMRRLMSTSTNSVDAQLNSGGQAPSYPIQRFQQAADKVIAMQKNAGSRRASVIDHDEYKDLARFSMRRRRSSVISGSVGSQSSEDDDAFSSDDMMSSASSHLDHGESSSGDSASHRRRQTSNHVQMIQAARQKRRMSIVKQKTVEDEINRLEITKLFELFQEADEDGTGELTEEQFISGFKHILGVGSERELKDLFMRVDANANGTLDWHEFSAYLLLGSLSVDVELARQDLMSTQFAKGPLPEQPIPFALQHKDMIDRIIVDSATNSLYTSARDGTVRRWTASTLQFEDIIFTYKNHSIVDLVFSKDTSEIIIATVDRYIFFYNTRLRCFTRHFHGVQVMPEDSVPDVRALAMLRPEKLQGFDPSILKISKQENPLNTSEEEIDQNKIILQNMLAQARKEHGVDDESKFMLDRLIKQSIVSDSRNDKELFSFIHLKNFIDTPSSAFLLVRKSQQTSLLDRQLLFVGCEEGTLLCYDITPDPMDKRTVFDVLHMKKFHQGAITHVSVEEIGLSECILTSSLDTTICLTNMSSFIGSPMDDSRHLQQTVLRGHKKGVSKVRWSSQLSLLVSAGRDRQLIIWNHSLAKIDNVLEQDNAAASIIDFYFIEKLSQIICLRADKQIRVWDVNILRLTQTIKEKRTFRPEDKITALALDAQNTLIFTATTFVEQYCTRGQLISQTKGKQQNVGQHTSPIRAVLVQDKFRQIISADDGLIQIWDKESGKVIFRYRPPNPIISMCFDHNKRRLIIAHPNGQVSISNFVTGQQLRLLEVPEKDDILAVTFVYKERQNTRSIIAGGFSRKVYVWDDLLECQNTPIRTFGPLSGDILCIEHIDPNAVAIGCADGTFSILDFQTGRINTQKKPQRKAQSILTTDAGGQRKARPKLHRRGTRSLLHQTSFSLGNVLRPESEVLSASPGSGQPSSGDWTSLASSSSSLPSTASSTAPSTAEPKPTVSPRKKVRTKIIQEAKHDRELLKDALQFVSCIAWLPAKPCYLIVGRGNGAIQFLDTRDVSTCLLWMTIDPEGTIGVTCFTLSATNDTLVVGDTIGRLHVFDLSHVPVLDTPVPKLEEGRHVRKVTTTHLHTRSISSVAVIPQRSLVVSASEDCTVKAMDLHGQAIGTLGHNMNWSLVESNPSSMLSKEVINAMLEKNSKRPHHDPASSGNPATAQHHLNVSLEHEQGPMDHHQHHVTRSYHQHHPPGHPANEIREQGKKSPTSLVFNRRSSKQLDAPAINIQTKRDGEQKNLLLAKQLLASGTVIDLELKKKIEAEVEQLEQKAMVPSHHRGDTHVREGHERYVQVLDLHPRLHHNPNHSTRSEPSIQITLDSEITPVYRLLKLKERHNKEQHHTAQQDAAQHHHHYDHNMKRTSKSNAFDAYDVAADAFANLGSEQPVGPQLDHVVPPKDTLSAFQPIRAGLKQSRVYKVSSMEEELAKSMKRNIIQKSNSMHELGMQPLDLLQHRFDSPLSKRATKIALEPALANVVSPSTMYKKMLERDENAAKFSTNVLRPCPTQPLMLPESSTRQILESDGKLKETLTTENQMGTLIGSVRNARALRMMKLNYRMKLMREGFDQVSHAMEPPDVNSHDIVAPRASVRQIDDVLDNIEIEALLGRNARSSDKDSKPSFTQKMLARGMPPELLDSLGFAKSDLDLDLDLVASDKFSGAVRDMKQSLGFCTGSHSNRGSARNSRSSKRQTQNVVVSAMPEPETTAFIRASNTRHPHRPSHIDDQFAERGSQTARF